MSRRDLPLTKGQLYSYIETVMPGVATDVDNDGQIVIYTGRYEDLEDSEQEALKDEPWEDE